MPEATLQPEDRARRDMAVAWMNRGHEATNRGDAEEALACYTKAIEGLSSLDRSENASWSNSLGAAHMNRGRLWHQLYGLARLDAAFQDFDAADAALDEVDEDSLTWVRRNRIGTAVNRANLLLDLKRPEEALSVAAGAIESLRSNDSPCELVDIQLTLLAHRGYCDAIGQLLPGMENVEAASELAYQAGESADQALALIRSLRGGDGEPFAELSMRFFRFGSGLFARYQPQFLGEFIHDHLENVEDPAIRLELVTIAREALELAVERLNGRAFELAENLEVMDRARDVMTGLVEMYQLFECEYAVA